MISPTLDDISRRVVCRFRGDEIFGTLTRFDDVSVFITTRLGEQAFAPSEVDWEKPTKAEIRAASGAPAPEPAQDSVHLQPVAPPSTPGAAILPPGK